MDGKNHNSQDPHETDDDDDDLWSWARNKIDFFGDDILSRESRTDDGESLHPEPNRTPSQTGNEEVDLTKENSDDMNVDIQGVDDGELSLYAALRQAPNRMDILLHTLTDIYEHRHYDELEVISMLEHTIPSSFECAAKAKGGNTEICTLIRESLLAVIDVLNKFLEEASEQCSAIDHIINKVVGEYFSMVHSHASKTPKPALSPFLQESWHFALWKKFSDCNLFQTMRLFLSRTQGSPDWPKILQNALTILSIFPEKVNFIDYNHKGYFHMFKDTALEVKTCYFDTVLNMSNEQMRQFNWNFLYQFCMHVECALIMTMSFVEASREIYGYRFALALKASKCPYLTFRLKGIEQFNDLATRGKQHKGRNDADDAHWLNPTTFWELVERHNVIEEYLGSRMQPEILKRIDPFFEFLVSEGYWTFDIMQKLWKASEQAHESVVAIVYEKIVFVVQKGLGERNIQILEWLANLIRERFFLEDESCQLQLSFKGVIEKSDHKPDQTFLSFIERLNRVLYERPYICGQFLVTWSKLLVDIYMVGTCEERQESSFLVRTTSVGPSVIDCPLSARECSKVRDALRSPPERFGMCEACFSYWSLLREFFQGLNTYRRNERDFVTNDAISPVAETSVEECLEIISRDLKSSNRFVKAIYLLLSLMDVLERLRDKSVAATFLASLRILPAVTARLESKSILGDSDSDRLTIVDYTLRLHALLKMHVTVECSIAIEDTRREEESCMLTYGDLVRMYDTAKQHSRLKDIFFLFIGHLFNFDGPHLLKSSGTPLSVVSKLKLVASSELKYKIWTEMLYSIASEQASPAESWAFSIGFLWANSSKPDNAYEHNGGNHVTDRSLDCDLASFEDIWKAGSSETGAMSSGSAISLYVNCEKYQTRASKTKSRMTLCNFSKFGERDLGKLFQMFCLCPYETFPELLDLMSTLSFLPEDAVLHARNRLHSSLHFSRLLFNGVAFFLGAWYTSSHSAGSVQFSRLRSHQGFMPDFSAVVSGHSPHQTVKALSRLLQMIHRVLVYSRDRHLLGEPHLGMPSTFAQSVDPSYIPIHTVFIPPRCDETFLKGVPVANKFLLSSDARCEQICHKSVAAMREAGFTYAASECKVFCPHPRDIPNLQRCIFGPSGGPQPAQQELRERMSEWLSPSVFSRLRHVDQAEFVSHNLEGLLPFCVVQIPPSTVEEVELEHHNRDFGPYALPTLIANSAFAFDVLLSAAGLENLSEEDLLAASGGQSSGMAAFSKKYVPIRNHWLNSTEEESSVDLRWSSEDEREFQESQTLFPKALLHLLPNELERSVDGGKLAECLDLNNHRASARSEAIAEHFAITASLIFNDSIKNSSEGSFRKSLKCVALQAWDILTSQLPLSDLAVCAVQSPSSVSWREYLELCVGSRKGCTDSLNAGDSRIWDDKISALYLMASTIALLQKPETWKGVLLPSWREEFIHKGGLASFAAAFCAGSNVGCGATNAMCCAVFEAASITVSREHQAWVDIEEIDPSATSILQEYHCETYGWRYLLQAIRLLRMPLSTDVDIVSDAPELAGLQHRAVAATWITRRLAASHFAYMFCSYIHTSLRGGAHAANAVDSDTLTQIIEDLSNDDSASTASIPSVGLNAEKASEFLGKKLVIGRCLGDCLCMAVRRESNFSRVLLQAAAGGLSIVSQTVRELQNSQANDHPGQHSAFGNARVPVLNHVLFRTLVAVLRCEAGWKDDQYQRCVEIVSVCNEILRTISCSSGISITSENIEPRETPVNSSGGNSLARFPVLDIGSDLENLACQCILIVREALRVFCTEDVAGSKLDIFAQLFDSETARQLVVFLLRNVLAFCSCTIVEVESFRQLTSECIGVLLQIGFSLLRHSSSSARRMKVMEIFSEVITHSTHMVSQFSWSDLSSSPFASKGRCLLTAIDSASAFRVTDLKRGPLCFGDEFNIQFRSSKPVTHSAAEDIRELVCLAEKDHLSSYVEKQQNSSDSDAFTSICPLHELVECQTAMNHPFGKGSKYVGLVNQGMTCYMNSLLQQLFMIPSLRRAILMAREPTQIKTQRYAELLSGLRNEVQLLFAILSSSHMTVHNPLSLVHALRDEPRGFFPIGLQCHGTK
eukprot:gb/GECG01002853.1/.p1 GENE.gb/GECG01002853.1/~~gb/GECG01002853.1/.p1  ORF type:complete len:2095 (+),score=208.94 gb/GECG01002853.1/:1-6285(+)